MTTTNDRTPAADAILVTIDSAAALLSLSARTVWGMANRGELPFVRIGRALRFRRVDLEKWAAENAKIAS